MTPLESLLEELKLRIASGNARGLSNFIKRSSALKEHLNRKTKFLAKDPFYTWSTKVYCFLNGIRRVKDLPHCKKCKRLIRQNASPISGFKHEYCSKRCSVAASSYFASDEFHSLKVKPLYDKIMKSDVVLLHTFEEFANLYHYEQEGRSKTRRCDAVFSWKCKKCGNIFLSKVNKNYNRKLDPKNYARCTNCYPYTFSGKSRQELEMLQYVKSIYNGEIVSGDRSQIKVGRNPSEIDIWLPELKIGIEYNGLFWHCNRLRHQKTYNKSTKDNNFKHLRMMNHLKKNKAAEKLGIKLVQIWEHEWLYNKEKMKKLIYDIIFNKVDFLQFALSDDDSVIEVPRDKFNLTYKIEGYRLHKIIKPSVVKLKFLHGKTPEHFSYRDCGCLEYRKI